MRFASLYFAPLCKMRTRNERWAAGSSEHDSASHGGPQIDSTAGRGYLGCNQALGKAAQWMHSCLWLATGVALLALAFLGCRPFEWLK